MGTSTDKALGILIGRRIYEACHTRHVHLTTLAKKVHIDIATLYLYKGRGIQPRAETIVKICRYLGVSAGYLLGLESYDSNVSFVPEKDQIHLRKRKQCGLRKAKADQKVKYDWGRRS